MATIQFSDIEIITAAGNDLDELDLISIRTPENDEPYWKFQYRDGTTIITDGPVFIRGQLLDASMIPSKEELDV